MLLTINMRAYVARSVQRGRCADAQQRAPYTAMMVMPRYGFSAARHATFMRRRVRSRRVLRWFYAAYHVYFFFAHFLLICCRATPADVACYGRRFLTDAMPCRFR